MDFSGFTSSKLSLSLADMAVPVTAAAFNLGVGVAVGLLVVVVMIEAAVFRRMDRQMSKRAAMLRSGAMNAVSTGLGTWLVIDVAIESADRLQEFGHALGHTSRLDTVHYVLRNWFVFRIDHWLGWLIVLIPLCLISVVVEFLVLRITWRTARWGQVARVAWVTNLASYAFLAVVIPILRA